MVKNHLIPLNYGLIECHHPNVCN
uniref:Uncharacterized protein n=1 Tax=Rhizophora mucronata TaxID=61149 RepID=A0A2P2PDU2_RHIMU